jgi:eukaryotic-like serine/threonine-protein kinase
MSTAGATEELIIAGRYRVIRELGRGGMGSVYEAENLRTHRRVALKTMRPEMSERPDFAHRFEREAQAGGRLRHPNIIDVLDMGDDEASGLVFIVQEFLEGGDLARCLKRVEALPPHAALATLLPIMDALSLAHDHGVIHRDVKPDNIFLHQTPQGVVPKLIDFGIAKFSQSEEELSRTVSGQMVGSPNYMSPEQARGDGDLDPRTDVWSMGIVLYKCLSRSIPYRAPTTSALIAKIIYEEPTALAELAPHLPPDLVAVVQRAVTKDREQRWPSMRAFADALRGCSLWQGVDAARAQQWIVDAQGASAEPPPSVVPSWPPEDLAPPTPDRSSGVSSGQRSGPWGGEVPARPGTASALERAPFFLAAIVAVLGVGVATTAVILWPRRPPPTAIAAHAAAVAAPPPAPAPIAAVEVAQGLAPVADAAVSADDAPLAVEASADDTPLADEAPVTQVIADEAPAVVAAPAPARARRRPRRPPSAPVDAVPARRGHNGALIMH